MSKRQREAYSLRLWLVCFMSAMSELEEAYWVNFSNRGKEIYYMMEDLKNRLAREPLDELGNVYEPVIPGGPLKAFARVAKRLNYVLPPTLNPDFQITQRLPFSGPHAAKEFARTLVSRFVAVAQRLPAPREKAVHFPPSQRGPVADFFQKAFLEPLVPRLYEVLERVKELEELRVAGVPTSDFADKSQPSEEKTVKDYAEALLQKAQTRCLEEIVLS